jgi:hypothetical protein
MNFSSSVLSSSRVPSGLSPSDSPFVCSSISASELEEELSSPATTQWQREKHVHMRIEAKVKVTRRKRKSTFDALEGLLDLDQSSGFPRRCFPAATGTGLGLR